MDVKALQWELAAFVAERGLESRHSPKSLAMALVGEGGTLLDLFKWLGEDESRQIGRQEREAVAEAIAEIFLHALRLADELGIDVEDAVARKSSKLGGKAPPDRRPEAPRAPPPPPERRPEAPRAPPPPPAAASVERQLRSATRPVPLAGPPSVRPPSRAASAAPDFPRTRPAAPPAPARPPAGSPPPRTAAPPPPPRPAPAARPAAPPQPPPPAPEVEPYADLDLEAVSELVKSLAKRIDNAQSEDPLVRELHDELGTLRRTLYSKTFKRAWVGASLKNVRTMLGAVLNEDIGEEIRAKEHIARIDDILKD